MAGSNTGPFNLYSDVDGYVSPFESSISKSTLLAGFVSTSVPLGTTIIRARSAGECTNYIDMPIEMTTTSSTSTTTTSTTTSCSYLQIDVRSEDLNDSENNTSFPDGTLFVEYRNCNGQFTLDTFDTPDVASNTTECWNGTGVSLYYYREDVQTVAEFSSIINAGECTA